MKNYPCFLVYMVAAVSALAGMLSSCTSNEDPAPGLRGGNAFVYGDTESSIESVVYTVDADKVYTFYFSPTKGLVDLDAMLLADDYIKIVTNTPTGEIDLTSAGNSLVYKNLEVSSATADKVSRKSLSLQLTSTTTLEMNLDVAMTDGTSLLAAYDGLCFNGETGADAITLDKQIFFYYMGDAENGAGTSNYYLAVTNLEDWQGSGENFKPLSEGYILTLDFYGEKGDDWTAFPDGTFTESSGHEAQTYYSASAYSFVTYCAASGTSTDLKLTGEPVTVTRNDNGTVTVTAEFIDVDGNDRTITFTGELNISNGTFTSYLPQIGKDVYFDGIPTEERPGMGATANYYGDLYGVGSGLIEVLMYDTATANNIPGGYAMIVTFCTNTFNDTKNLRIPEGTYQVNETMGQFTALPGSEVEIPLFAIVVPSGTYASYTDETETGYYSYASGGTIKVSQSGDSGYYTLEFDLVTRDGYTITGAYNGDIEISDQSEDDGNDGSTNLEENVEMDLSYLPSASCFPRDQIYAAGLGMIDVDDIDNAELFTPVGQACGYQVIDIGAATGYFEPNPLFPERGKLHEGDVIRMDLLVEPGTEDRITPGTYTVTSNRYPAQMKPGVCVRGYTGTEGNDGTRYLALKNAIGNGFPYGLADEYKTDEYRDEYFMIDGPLNIASVDKFACIYEGTVTISKSDKGENWYTFDIDGKDVLKHTISGTWTGPVYLNGDTSSPVLPSGMPAVSSVSYDNHVSALGMLKSAGLGTCPARRVSFGR